MSISTAVLSPSKERIVRSKVVFKAFNDSLPVLFGYLPLGGVYGILFSKLGVHWAYSTLTSLFVFAGAAQYLSVALLSAGVPLYEIFLSTLIINIRHLFYGFSFLKRYGDLRWQDLYKICTLTDETYSLLTASRRRDKVRDDRYCFSISLFNHTYWVLGCTLGAVLGEYINLDPKGLSFVLTALFVVLVIEQYKSIQLKAPFIEAGFIGAVVVMIFPSQMLPVSLLLSCLLLLAKYFRVNKENR
jgi:4-azaleucine resistance transporter AzlC